MVKSIPSALRVMVIRRDSPLRSVTFSAKSAVTISSSTVNSRIVSDVSVCGMTLADLPVSLVPSGCSRPDGVIASIWLTG